MSLLKENKFDCRVSSVLNKNVRSYGKKYMFDNSNETCWNSDAGSPQWIVINFEGECNVSSFEIEFQGGFAGKDCHIEAGNDEKDMTVVEAFYPEDTNKLQRFNLKNQIKAKTFKFVFNQSSIHIQKMSKRRFKDVLKSSRCLLALLCCLGLMINNKYKNSFYI